VRFPSLGLLFGDLGNIIRNIFTVATGNQTIFNRTVGVFNGFFSGLTVLVISFYLVAEQKGMISFIKSLVPPNHQDFAMTLVRKIQNRMGRWVIGQLILSFCIFAVTFAGLSLLGVKYALFLALLAGLLEVIPYIGPFVAAVPAIFFAFLQSPALGVAVAGLYLLVQKTEGYFLVPKIMEKTVGTSPLLVLISLLIGYKLAGILGLLLAVPLVSAISLVITELYANQNPQNHDPELPLP
jgi:predicted PurR-regulated permease PerM